MNRKDSILRQSICLGISSRRERFVSITNLRQSSPPPNPQIPFVSADGINDVFIQARLSCAPDLAFFQPVQSTLRRSEPRAALPININRTVDFSRQACGDRVGCKYAVAQPFDAPPGSHP